MVPPIELRVIGGAYRERISEPAANRLLGSGVRAAATLVSLGGANVQLVTRIDAESAEELAAVAHGFGFGEVHTERATPISFNYGTAIDIPTQSQQREVSSAPMDSSGDWAVAFGMVEGPWNLRAKCAVVDPQHARLDECGLAQSEIERLALILNSAEVERLVGSCDQALAMGLMNLWGAEVLIVKRGALGAWVFHDNECETVFAFRTPCVSPVGSGDAFTAGFAHAWMVQGKSPMEAALFASKVAAAQSTFATPAITQEFVDAVGADEVVGDPGRVYLASPFFAPGERWLLERARNGLISLGADVFSPLHDVGLGGDEVAAADVEGLDRCDGVLALLDGSDPGTLFEIGWARKMNIPVVAYSSRPNSAQWTMLRGTGCTVTDDFATAIYHATWAAMRPLKG